MWYANEMLPFAISFRHLDFLSVRLSQWYCATHIHTNTHTHKCVPNHWEAQNDVFFPFDLSTKYNFDFGDILCVHVFGLNKLHWMCDVMSHIRLVSSYLFQYSFSVLVEDTKQKWAYRANQLKSLTTVISPANKQKHHTNQNTMSKRTNETKEKNHNLFHCEWKRIRRKKKFN